jgi:hypothetical protein
VASLKGFGPLLVVASALLLIAQNSPPETPRIHQTNDTHEHQQPAQANPPPSAVPSWSVSTQVGQASSAPDSHKAEEHSQKWHFSDAFAPPTWSNWVLGALAVIAAIIGLRTLGKINAQTRETAIALRINRVAASAAKRSADAQEKSLVYLERPWIFIDIVKFDGFQLGTPIASIKSAGLMNGTLGWWFRNYGRSLALIVEGGIRIKVLNRPFPEPPDYGNSGPIVPVPMGPNKLIRNNTPWLMDADDYQRVIRDEASLVFYGFIWYRNTFQSTVVHVSRWCAVLKVPTLRLAGQPDWYWAFEGPPSYTEYT